MDQAAAVPITLPQAAEFTMPDPSRAITMEITKEFVRRPAKGWTGSTPVPVVRFDHHCAVWESR